MSGDEARQMIAGYLPSRIGTDRGVGARGVRTQFSAGNKVAAMPRKRNQVRNAQELVKLYEAGERRFAWVKVRGFLGLIRANLGGADLRKADLYRVNLRGADLRKKANLRGANLSQADLRGAGSRGAKLGKADLRGARYDQVTQWPANFDPTQAGAIRED